MHLSTTTLVENYQNYQQLYLWAKVLKTQLRVISEGFSLTSFGYHIKSKHDVFSDGSEQKCLRLSQMSF